MIKRAIAVLIQAPAASCIPAIQFQQLTIQQIRIEAKTRTFTMTALEKEPTWNKFELELLVKDGEKPNWACELELVGSTISP
jgi:hypothetical protein